MLKKQYLSKALGLLGLITLMGLNLDCWGHLQKYNPGRFTGPDTGSGGQVQAPSSAPATPPTTAQPPIGTRAVKILHGDASKDNGGYSFDVVVQNETLPKLLKYEWKLDKAYLDCKPTTFGNVAFVNVVCPDNRMPVITCTIYGPNNGMAVVTWDASGKSTVTFGIDGGKL